MADKLSIVSAAGSYLTIKELAHSGARTKGAPELVAGILMFPLDDYADAADHLLIYKCAQVEAYSTAANTVLAQVNFTLGQRLYWDASASKITNVSAGNTPIGRCLKANDLSSAVPAGSVLLFELDPSANLRVVSGTVTLDGSNPTPVTTGLTAVVNAVVTLKATSTPGDDPASFSVGYSGGTLNIYAYKTDGSDPTLVASTNNAATVDWIATGY